MACVNGIGMWCDKQCMVYVEVYLDCVCIQMVGVCCVSTCVCGFEVCKMNATCIRYEQACYCLVWFCGVRGCVCI